MVFKYKAVTTTGEKKEGVIEAVNKDLAISALQRRGLVILSIYGDEPKGIMANPIFQRVAMRDVVILSRQIATLFEAQVSALKAFTLLASNSENKYLGRTLTQVIDDLQAGFSISGALAKHPKVFSDFYVNMVRAGEESGKLSQTFVYLADYLDRQYELTTKTRNALIYPAFVITVFIAVMILMLVMVIPKLSQLIIESGQQVPIYTRVIIGISNFFVDYGIFFGIALVIAIIWLIMMARTEKGKVTIDSMKLTIPLFGNLFKKVYLSRISDNMDTMLSAGIPIVRSIEITASVVGNKVYGEIMKNTSDLVKGGSSFSDALGKHAEMPAILIQMIKVGEETGSVTNILKTLARFYKREVDEAVDTLVGLIEPVMIVVLGIGVGVLLSAILIPIYNIASSIQ
jgi:type IV pilus assembly protein PilC